MNELLKLANKVDIKKTAITIGVILLLVIIYLVIRKMIRKAKAEKQDEKLINVINDSVVTSNLTYTEAEYAIMAASLRTYFTDQNSGLLGIDQKGIYDVMGRMKTNDDVAIMIEKFGTIEYRKNFTFGKETYNLVEAMSKLLTAGERRQVNNILKENGVTFQF